MFGFGSSSSSSASGSSSSSQADLGGEIERPAPTREERKACWGSRDLYFGCLDKNRVLQAGDELKRDAKGNVVPGSVCDTERGAYEKDCGKAWIDYFNKRRTLEMRRLATIEAAEKTGNNAAADAWRGVGAAQQKK
ncbi:hypothetical protein IAU60_002700 [Kwoniella sp. DSM 27419]